MNLNDGLLLAAISGALLGAPACASQQAHANEPGAMSASDMAAGDKHGCKGQNACKGQGGCKTDKNGCRGQNACKGQGGCKTA